MARTARIIEEFCERDYDLVEQVYQYIAAGTYPIECSQNKNRIIRKKSKRFMIKDGELSHLEKRKRGVREGDSSDLNINSPAVNSFLKKEEWLRYVKDIREQKKILHACHVDATAGHLGRQLTLHRMKERFMWLGMYKDVQELVSV